jgi:hypothetical protein
MRDGISGVDRHGRVELAETEGEKQIWRRWVNAESSGMLHGTVRCRSIVCLGEDCWRGVRSLKRCVCVCVTMGVM